jgi:hypothetical protein
MGREKFKGQITNGGHWKNFKFDYSLFALPFSLKTLDVLWVDMNYPKTFVYDDAHVNVLEEEALPFQMNNKSRGIERDKRNPKYRNYNFKDLTILAQTLSRIYSFYRVGGHIIPKCLQIDSEIRDGFVKHVGQ